MKKCDRESARRRTHWQTDRLTHWHTDTLTDANRFYNLSHAICYSYGTDKKNWENADDDFVLPKFDLVLFTRLWETELIIPPEIWAGKIMSNLPVSAAAPQQKYMRDWNLGWAWNHYSEVPFARVLQSKHCWNWRQFSTAVQLKGLSLSSDLQSVVVSTVLSYVCISFFYFIFLHFYISLYVSLALSLFLSMVSWREEYRQNYWNCTSINWINCTSKPAFMSVVLEPSGY